MKCSECDYHCEIGGEMCCYQADLDKTELEVGETCPYWCPVLYGIENAFDVIKEAMEKDSPSEKGSYAHSWHCNIAMMVYDSIMDEAKFTNRELAHKIGNDAASRFMKLCFGVETK